ncbi:MAG: AMP-binding protein, partial [Burkholderiaceae bacterium]
MDRFWLKNYPAGVAADIDPNQYKSLIQLFDEAFRKHADKGAYSFMGKEMTFKELEQHSTATGAWLQSRGYAKGTRIAIMLPNVLQYPVAMAGILRAGYTVVNVNPLYTPRELEHQLKDSGAEAIFILENFATTLQQVIDKVPAKTVVVCAMGDMLGFPKGAIVNFVVRNVKKMVPAFSLPNALRWNDVLAEGAKMTLKQADCSHKDIAFLQYTGGTTGVSKGATLTHRN